MMGFIFDTSKGETPESVKRKREMADAIFAGRGQQRTPQTVAEAIGQGLSGFGDAISYRRLVAQAAAGEDAGQAQAQSAFAPILAALGGGNQQFPAAPGQASGTAISPQQQTQAAPSPANPAPFAAPDAPTVPSSAGGDWLHYANQGATRNQQLDPKLVNALGFLPDMGVSMEVFSGGQPGKGEGGARVGSTRHDHGNAADVFFIKDGRRLDWNNPQDRPIFEEIVRRGRSGGVTGFGAGDGYMRPGSMHIGFGNPGVWGAGGRGANAPDWLRNAFDSPHQAANPATAAINRIAVPEAPAQVAQAAPQTMTDAMPEMAGATQSAPPQGRQQGIPLPQLLQAAQNPWVAQNPLYSGIVNTLLENQLKMNQPLDPLQKVQMEKMLLEVEQMRNPKPEYDFITGRDGSIFRTDSSGGMNQVYGGKPDQIKPTADIQEYEYAKGQGFQGSFADYQQSMKKAGAQSINIDQKTEGAFDKKLAEGQAESFNAMAEEGLTARSDIAVIGELDSLLGENGGVMTGLAGWLAQKGIGGEGMSDLQAAQALINKLVPTQRQAGSGSMSDRDVELFTRSLPSLWNTPGGNQKIIRTMRGLAEYKQAQGEIADQVMTGEMSRQEARRALRALPNPLRASPQKSDGQTPQAGAIIDGYRFKGGDPGDQNNWEPVN